MRRVTLSLIAMITTVCMLAGCGSSNTAATTAAPAATEAVTEAATEAAEEQTEAPAETEEQTEAPAETEECELIVFAAASMTETLTEIKALYEAEHPGVTIVYNFDSSGTLKTQIQEGAPCDLFISAGQKQMNQMDAQDTTDSNTENLDLIASETRVNLLENKVVLVAPEQNPAGLESFDDLAAKLTEGGILLAMGNEDVPVGQYTKKILDYYQLSEEELAQNGCITYGTNVKEVTTQVVEGSVDCGVVYCTDAFSAGLTALDAATAEMCGQVIYPAAVTKGAEQPEAAQEFLDYLFTEPCTAIFENVGFTAIAK